MSRRLWYTLLEKCSYFRGQFRLAFSDWSSNYSTFSRRRRLGDSYDPWCTRTIADLSSDTKYDASSADISPLGSISKIDIKKFQRWALIKWELPILQEFIEATATAELLPLEAGIQDGKALNSLYLLSSSRCSVAKKMLHPVWTQC